MAVIASDRGRSAARAGFFYRPEVRQAIYQIVTVVALVALFYILITNTAANLKRQNIASGFGFIDRTAGFDVSQHLIDFDASMTYGRAFLVGLLNTLLVAGLGIVLATVIGFTVGISRLSTNWLVARLATVYVEVIRNVPVLLQLFFWYFAVLKSLPVPRQSHVLPGGGFLNVRGLYLPAPVPEPGFGTVALAVLIGVVASIGVYYFARRRQMRTGQRFPVLWTSLALIVLVPLGVFIVLGQPLSFEYPELKGFNFQGGMVLQPEFVALLLGLSIYTASFIAEIVRAGIMGVHQGPEGSGDGDRPVEGTSAAPRRHPAGLAHHHPAADQPVPEPDQELLAGRGHRLSRPRLDLGRHRAQPDRPGGRGDPRYHGRVPVAEPAHIGFHELVQPAHGAGGAVGAGQW